MLTVFDYFKKNNTKNKNIINFVIGIKTNNELINGVNYIYQPYLVLNRIQNRELRKYIIKVLIENNYDFNSDFPYELFENVPTMKIIKENLQKEYDYYNFYILKGSEFVSGDGLKGIEISTNTNLNKFAFYLNYDLVMNSYEKSIFLIINPKLAKEYSFSNLYNKLNKIEKDNWVIWKGETVLKTKKGSKTNIKPSYIKKLILDYTLK